MKLEDIKVGMRVHYELTLDDESLGKLAGEVVQINEGWLLPVRVTDSSGNVKSWNVSPDEVIEVLP